MTLFQNILDKAHAKALHALYDYGIYTLAHVPVKIDLLSPDSFCLGYAMEDQIAITVNGMRLAEAFVSKSSREALTEFLVHEYGHAFLFKVWNGPHFTLAERLEFFHLFGDYHSDGEGYKHRISDTLRGMFGMKPREFDHERFVSLYAVCSPHEDWAETFAFLVCGKTPATGKKAAYIQRLIEKYGKDSGSHSR